MQRALLRSAVGEDIKAEAEGAFAAEGLALVRISLGPQRAGKRDVGLPDPEAQAVQRNGPLAVPGKRLMVGRRLLHRGGPQERHAPQDVLLRRHRLQPKQLGARHRLRRGHGLRVNLVHQRRPNLIPRARKRKREIENK